MRPTIHSTLVRVEPLEPRSLYSASPLSPSAAEGTYRGSLSYSKIKRELKVTVTPTSETVTVVGIGSETDSLASLQFHRLRDGTFTSTVKIDGETLSFTGALSSTGKTITGTFTGSGRVTISGTFDLKKR